jgi:hypothetical protein
LGVRQNESLHPQLESRTAADENPESQQTLSRPEGATIDDLLSATMWLPHTTRAALTGLRKEGYEFVKSKNEEGETVYRTEKAGKRKSANDAG